VGLCGGDGVSQASVGSVTVAVKVFWLRPVDIDITHNDVHFQGLPSVDARIGVKSVRVD
jgi:hypothetical protein